MKPAFTIAFIFIILALSACASKPKPISASHIKVKKITMEEMDAKFAAKWNSPQYKKADSANSELYLTEREKRVYHYLNLARMNPPLFANTYATAYMGEQRYVNLPDFADKKRSLLKQLEHTTPMNPLVPDHALYISAKCHSTGIGTKGLETHDRKLSGCPEENIGENITFGRYDALEVVMSLLVDTGNSGLAHRENCLDPRYRAMGISIQPHIKDEETAVLDLSY